MTLNKKPKKRIKSLLGPFIFIFLVTFFSWNWNEVSWVFNGQYLSDVLSRFFLAEKSATAEEGFIYVEKEDSIFVPRIQVQAPLVFSPTDKPEDITEALKKGVLHYPHSVLPGEKGRVIILGHSAPPGWPKINYYHIFNKLNELKEGDEIFVYYKNRQYNYQLTRKYFVERGTELDPFSLTNSEEYVLILLSCWPPGQRNQRIVIEAQQLN